ncbi:MAG: fbpA 4 [Noviherbaspirillum sp.]|nr:fbpA 4 [Noviherbaspirillum sp.]MDB5795711.1 fbpA 4 [Noviherbaspirillum sp.]
MNSLARIFVLSALLNVAAVASAQSLASIAQYEGPDRQARLIEGAKKEGSLTLYATTPIDYLRIIIGGFEQKYGVKVNLWRSRSENVLQRIVTESRSSAPSFDVVECITTPMEALHKEGLLQKINAPVHRELQPWGLPAHREWAATQLYTFVQSYNTDKVKKEDLPKTYMDLLDPKWKGKLSMEASDHEWFSEVIKQMGEEKGLKFWRDLVATNGVQVRTGHSLLNNLVGAGEVPLALTVYNSDPETLKKKGSPIEWFAIEPAIAIPNGVGVARKAPHPHAAVLFYEYMLSEEAQNVLAKIGYITSQKKIASNFNKQLKVLDPAVLLEESAKSQALFDQVVVKGAAR